MTIRQILRENLCTFFNFLNLVLAILVLLAGSPQNALFMGTVLANTAIGIFQQLRAKKTLDSLRILAESQVLVKREKGFSPVPAKSLAVGDQVLLKLGSQVPADVKILEGEVEVNEALLTGEAEELLRRPGDRLLSGSAVTSGQALCQVLAAGEESYAGRLQDQARRYAPARSELREGLDRILKFTSSLIVPLGFFLFLRSLHAGGDWREAMVSTVAAMVGMIPEGLILLTSITLSVGAVNLARKQTLVRDLFCIEALARVDTLCLDKTGTLTTGRMHVDRLQPLNASKEQVARAMANLMEVSKDDNATMQAFRGRFYPRRDMEAQILIPFSSARKYSGAYFKGEGTFLLGAAGFLFPEGKGDLFRICEAYAREGLRVVVLAHSPDQPEGYALPPHLEPWCVFALSDQLRPTAAKTISYFYDQGVNLKVISGDDPASVSAMAVQAGIRDADRYLDASGLKDSQALAAALGEYTVFGRVSPVQKQEMVRLLRQAGHGVAMTGDGVNDILAMKEADCAIAMAQGSDAAKQAASVVLLDCDFSALPQVVNQGRRVIRNIRTAASMFLIKTLFSALLSVLMILWGKPYPFQPIQMTLIGACAVGIPTFFLAQEPNYDKVEGGFLGVILRQAVPSAISISGCVLILMAVCHGIYHSEEMLGTACVLVTGWNYMDALKRIYAPLNSFRTLVIYGMQLIFFLAALALRNLLSLGGLEFGMIILSFALMAFTPLLTRRISQSATFDPGK